MPAGQARKRGDGDGDAKARHRAAAAESRAARDRTRAAREERRTVREGRRDSPRRDRGHSDEPFGAHPALADGYGDPPSTEDMPRPADALLEPVNVNEVRERLAALEHERWAGWQGYLMGRGERHDDGSVTLSAADVEHWTRQVNTRYADLTRREQLSDLEQVDRYWPVLEEWIRDTLGGP